MNSIELAQAVDFDRVIIDLERPYTNIGGPDPGSVDWKRMRDGIGEERWRGYIRMRQIVRESNKQRAA